jgi:antitoxin component YwqK of YwqJK toxin-antitoxin module
MPWKDRRADGMLRIPTDYTGVWKDWYMNGSLHAVVEIAQGNTIRFELYLRNGVMTSQYLMTKIENGVVHGVKSYWDSEGKQIAQSEMVDDAPVSGTYLERDITEYDKSVPRILLYKNGECLGEYKP